MSDSVTDKAVDHTIPVRPRLLLLKLGEIFLCANDAGIRPGGWVNRQSKRIPGAGLELPNDFPPGSIANGKLRRCHAAFNSQRLDNTSTKEKPKRARLLRFLSGPKVDRKVHQPVRRRPQAVFEDVSQPVVG